MRHLNSSTQWGITTQAMQLTPKEKPAEDTRDRIKEAVKEFTKKVPMTLI